MGEALDEAAEELVGGAAVLCCAWVGGEGVELGFLGVLKKGGRGKGGGDAPM